MLIKKGRVVSLADNLDDNLDVRILNGRIFELGKDLSPFADEEVIEAKGLIITPGLVDMHCNLREPGYEYKETIKTGLDSAVSGGFTVVCPMANTNPATDSVMTLKYVFDRAKEADSAAVYPVCALTKNLEGEVITNFSELKDNGAVAFSDDGKPVENMKLLKTALEYAKSLDCLVIMHSEDTSLAKNGVINESVNSGKLGLEGISTLAESVAIARELEIARCTGARVHFAHISTKRSVELIRNAKNEGLNVTCETAPHYFSMSEDNMPPYDARFKMNPPLRSAVDVQAIIDGLVDGTIDAIATDHAPHSDTEKMGLIQNSPMGITGFETALALTITNLVDKKHLTLGVALEKLSSAPAAVLRLENQGRIKIGQNANLCIFDKEHEWTVDAGKFMSKCKLSPFDGMKLKGKAIYTIINGEVKYNANISSCQSAY